MAGMPRFSIKDLLLGITLVAAGLGGMWCADAGFFGRLELNMLAWVVCGAVAGAGIGYPFRLWRLCAILGLIAAIIWGLILLSMPNAEGYYL
jgi:hypothetical protein